MPPPSIRLAGASAGALKLSRDQQLLAYALSPDDGSEAAVCIAKDLRTGALLQDCLLPAVGSFEWSADARFLYYTTPDEVGRPSKVYRHMLGTPASSDELLLSEPDPRHFVTLTRTKDWSFLLVNSHSKLSSEVHLLDASDPTAAPVLIQQREPGHEYFVEHWRGHLLLLSNMPPPATASGSSQEAKEPPPAAAAAAAAGPCDYSLMTVPAAAAATGHATADHWQLLRPERPGSAVTDLDVFHDRVVLHETAAGPRLTLLMLAERCQPSSTPQLVLQQEQQVVLPDWVFSLRPGINQDYHSSSMRLYASSPAVPEVPLQLDLTSAQLSVVGSDARQQQQQQTPAAVAAVPSSTTAAAAAAGGGSGSTLPPLQCRRLVATAADGTPVPLTLLQPQGLLAGQQPLLLEVYGAYGQALEADFRPHRLPLLQRGWSVALAHVRGGGERGRRWHAGGRKLLKRNSVQDLLACLQLLFDTGVSRPGLVAGHAVSAGGLTLATAVNAWPGAFGAVVMEAPYLDWAGSMAGVGQDVLAEHEIDEWGDPAADQRVAELITGMCPYTQLGAGSSSSSEFPAVLVTAGLMDTRVPFWMPLKYVAKLRALQQQQQQQQQPHATPGAPPEAQGSSSPLVLLQFDEASGHFSMGVSGGSLQDVAVQTAFLLHVLGIKQQQQQLALDGGV